MELQIISATWCKRCDEIKPKATAVAGLASTTLKVVDYDAELTEEERGEITKLPTLRFRASATDSWRTFLPTEFDAWKRTVLEAVILMEDNEDF